MKRCLSWALVVIAVTGCGGGSPGGSVDSGVRDGGSTPRDTGAAMLDSRTSTDDDGGGSEIDAYVELPDGAGIDAYVELPDGGAVEADAYVEPDAFVEPDAYVEADAGAPADSGPLGPPEWVDIDVLPGGTCAPLEPCGGDVVGTWDITGACIEVPLPAELMMCPGATVTTTLARARGRVSFIGGVATRMAESEIELQLYVPGICAAFVGGCPGVEDYARMAVPEATCTAGARGSCTCVARDVRMYNDTDGYTLAANQIQSDSTTKVYDYCISGDTLRYEDVSPEPPAREPGILQLGRR